MGGGGADGDPPGCFRMLKAPLPPAGSGWVTAFGSRAGWGDWCWQSECLLGEQGDRLGGCDEAQAWWGQQSRWGLRDQE